MCLMTLLAPYLLFAATASDYAGAAACAKCHPAQFQAQASSAHARALAPSKAPQPGLWAFGAGVQAVTFIKRLDADNYVELDETWYRRLNGMGRTPGHTKQGGIQHRVFDPEAGILRCFSCHSTGPQQVSAEHVITPH